MSSGSTTMHEHSFEPNRFVWGRGSIGELPRFLAEHECRRVLVVCGKNVGANEIVMDAVLSSIGEHHVHTYRGARSDTPLKSVERGVKIKREHNIDALVSVGGGSASDTAKGIAVLDAEKNRDLHDLKAVTDGNQRSIPSLPSSKDPVFVVSTTLSAAEVGYGFGITDEESGEKVGVYDEKMRPKVCIYDPELTATTPPNVIASTGMNALDHAVELLYSKTNAENPFYEATAEKAIRLLVTGLPEAVSTGTLDAIECSQLGAALSGLGLSGAVSINHGINHALCAQHPVSHGDGNSILLPHGIKFNFEVAPNRVRQIATAFGVSREVEDNSQALESLLDRIEDLQMTLGVPSQLRDVGVKRSDFEAIAEVAVHDLAMSNNPRPVEVDDIVAILESAY